MKNCRLLARVLTPLFIGLAFTASNRPRSTAARIALCLGIGAALMVSVNLTTGIAVAGGLFIALLPRAR